MIAYFSKSESETSQALKQAVNEARNRNLNLRSHAVIFTNISARELSAQEARILKPETELDELNHDSTDTLTLV